MSDFSGASGIGRRLAGTVVVLGFIAAVVTAAVQTYVEYRRDLALVDRDIAAVRTVHLPALADMVWVADTAQIATHLKGIVGLPLVERVVVTTDGGATIATGEAVSRRQRMTVLDLTHRHRGAMQRIGAVELTIGLDPLFERFKDRFLIALIAYGGQALVIAAAVLLAVHLLVTRHIQQIAAFSRSLSLDGTYTPLRLDRAAGRRDEFDDLVDGINQRAGALKAAYEDMESQVSARTGDLLQERDFVRVVIDSLPGVFYMLDTQGRFHLWNRNFTEITGYSDEEMRELVAPDLFPGREVPRVLEAMAQTFETGVGELQADFRYKSGREVPYFLTGRRLEHAGGLMLLGVGLDVSAQKKLEADLEHSNAELENFAYVASHDLKAPLRGIGQLATWIDDDLAETADEETRENLGLLRSRVARLEALLDGLLAYSRVGRIKGEAETVDTSALAREVADYIAPPPGFRIEIAPDMPRLHTPSAPLEMVLRNLIGNAIKHHDRDEGVVSVSARRAEGMVEFTIADDGPGIPTEFHEKVFGMFQTLRPRDEVEGSGMGLAIVRKAVEHHGGHIDVRSDNGARGTAIVFTWADSPAPTI